MKTCPNCQNPVSDNDMFCPNCGTRVDAQQTPDMNAGANQQPNYSQQQYSQQPNYSQQQYSQQPNYNQQQYSQQPNYNQQQYGQQPNDSQQQYSQQPNYNQQQYYNQPNNGYYPPQQNNWGINSTPYLVWSILNILFCCMPLGIWSLVLCVTLNKKPTYQDAEKSLKTAKTLCLIGTIVGFVVQAMNIFVLLANS